MRQEYETWFAEKFGHAPMPLDSRQIDFCWHGYQAGIESMHQQLAAALAACKQKDEALQEMVDLIGETSGVYGLHLNGDPSPWEEIEQGGEFERLSTLPEALAIQPDDDALKQWLGEPIGEVKKHTGSLKDMAIIVWSGEQPEEGAQLYIKPKGLK